MPASISFCGLPAPTFEHFTYPRYRPALRGDANNPRQNLARHGVVAGLRLDGRPVAAALVGSPSPDGQSRTLLSVTVALAHRRQGLGRELVQAVMGWARQQPGLCSLRARHSDRMKNPGAYLGLMRSCGWSEPSLVEQRLSGRVDWTHQVEAAWAPWLQRIDRQGYQATLYADRSAQDEACIADLQASGLVEGNLLLTPPRLRAEPALTLLLRRKMEVVGWIVGERALDFEGIHYTVGYVLPELRRTAWLLRGLYDACRRQEMLAGPASVALFETPSDNEGMQRLMEHRLGPLQPLWTDRRYEMEWQVPTIV